MLPIVFNLPLLLRFISPKPKLSADWVELKGKSKSFS